MENYKPILDYAVRVRKVKDEFYLVKNSEAWKINDVAKEIIKLCDGNNTLEAIAEKIISIYSVPTNQTSVVIKDCQEIIGFFHKEKLLN